MNNLGREDSHSGPLKIFKSIFILGSILIIGTVGYMIIEGWGLLDSVYMTVITITTVGYREIGDISIAGRIFTIFIIFSGVGIIMYILGMVAQSMVDLQVRSLIGRRKLGKKIKSMRDHYIICGYGRIGRIICRELSLNKIPLVVIETDPETIEGLERRGVPYVIGDATNEDVLLETRIERARGMVSVVASDADNLFITMSARVLNPGIFILARADEEQTEKKLLRAGANKVAMPYLIGGHKMAQIITKPAVTDFLDFTVQNRDMDLEMEEFLVDEKSALNGVPLINSNIRQDTNVIIVAIRKKDGEMTFNPSSQTSIEAEDTLISLGNKEDLARLATVLAGK